eukprot:625113-Rhodomonas_salina.1
MKIEGHSAHAAVSEGKGDVGSGDTKKAPGQEVGKEAGAGATGTRDLEVPKPGGEEVAKPVASRPKIQVVAVGAENLPKTDTFGMSDPYLVLKYGGKEAKTSVKKKTLNPVWKESFLLNVVPDDKDGNLEVRCMDWDMFHKDDYVGRCVVIKPELEKFSGKDGGRSEISLQLLGKDGKEIRGQHGKASRITLSLKLWDDAHHGPGHEHDG